MSDWLIYRGLGGPSDEIARLPPPPRWRTFADITGLPQARHDEAAWNLADLARGVSYQPEPGVLNPVNAALYLRLPLLVTGNPGVGKSSLAYSVAYELGLGPVLRWPITSSSVLKDGLYQYDAIGRLQEVNLRRDATTSESGRPDIGRFLSLGPLGTALLPEDTPRVLLIDEIDKANIDLPTDLLSVLEDGEYAIPELVRLAETTPEVAVSGADSTARTSINLGRVRCRQFPLVVLTSNGERELPMAFLRQCIRLHIEPPGVKQLERIVAAQLGPDISAEAGQLINAFYHRSETTSLAIDQLLNAIALTCRRDLDNIERTELEELLLKPLSSG